MAWLALPPSVCAAAGEAACCTLGTSSTALAATVIPPCAADVRAVLALSASFCANMTALMDAFICSLLRLARRASGLETSLICALTRVAASSSISSISSFVILLEDFRLPLGLSDLSDSPDARSRGERLKEPESGEGRMVGVAPLDE